MNELWKASHMGGFYLSLDTVGADAYIGPDVPNRTIHQRADVGIGPYKQYRLIAGIKFLRYSENFMNWVLKGRIPEGFML